MSPIRRVVSLSEMMMWQHLIRAFGVWNCVGVSCSLVLAAGGHNGTIQSLGDADKFGHDERDRPPHETQSSCCFGINLISGSRIRVPLSLRNASVLLMRGSFRVPDLWWTPCRSSPTTSASTVHSTCLAYLIDIGAELRPQLSKSKVPPVDTHMGRYLIWALCLF